MALLNQIILTEAQAVTAAGLFNEYPEIGYALGISYNSNPLAGISFNLNDHPDCPTAPGASLTLYENYRTNTDILFDPEWAEQTDLLAYLAKMPRGIIDTDLIDVAIPI